MLTLSQGSAVLLVGVATLVYMITWAHHQSCPYHCSKRQVEHLDSELAQSKQKLSEVQGREQALAEQLEVRVSNTSRWEWLPLHLLGVLQSSNAVQYVSRSNNRLAHAKQLEL